MARTPSMTIEAAKAMLGNPETFVCNSENRNIVRKWATAAGMSSKTIYKLNNDDLQKLYREHGNSTFSAPVVSAIPTPLPIINENKANALAEMIRAIASGAVNEDRVSAMIAEALVNFKPENPVVTHRLEVKTPVGINVVDGLQHNVTADVIAAVSLNHPVMMIGPAGCGKTTIGENVAKALNLAFFITSTVFDTHELMGFVDGNGNYHSTSFRMAFELGGVWVADEIDAWDAAALLAMNSALANGYATFPDRAAPIRRHADFRVIATANTYGHGADRMYVGRNELDSATLDRFASIDVDYDRKLEKALSNNTEWLDYVWQVRDKVRSLNIRHVVSTRAILMGQAALNAGMSRDKVESIYLFKGMSKSDRNKI